MTSAAAGLVLGVGGDVDPLRRARVCGGAERAEAEGLVVEDSDSPVRGSIVVDALLGTGMRGAPRSGYAEAIEAINSVDGYVLSIDLPSGLNADTGSVTLAVKADVTVSFIAR